MRYGPIKAVATLILAAAGSGAPYTATVAAPRVAAPQPQTVAPAATPTETMRLRALFDAQAIEPSWFSPGFLAQVPAAQVQEIITGLRTTYGSPNDVQLSEGRGVVLFDKARIPVRIDLDQQQRIETLWFGPPQLEAASLEALTQDFQAAASGEVSIYVTVDARPVIDKNSARSMAVGSAFKLVVLKAYENAIQSGQLKRDQVAVLRDQDRSLPTGTLQILPPATPVTLESLAQLMIRISDNTATDALIRLLGRDSMEALSPNNVPFLTTRELFQLTAAGAEDRRARFKDGSRQDRRDILAELAGAPLPAVDRLGTSVTWRDAEWRFTAREICGLLRDVNDAPAFDRPAHPLFERLDWQRIAYKGGSERGVLNLSALGTTRDGREVCAVATANGDGAQPEGRLAQIFVALVQAAGR